MSLDALTTEAARNILDMAESIDHRLTDEAESGLECDPSYLRDYVAWLARQVARLAEDAGERAATRKAFARVHVSKEHPE